jgi:hypothetical protein
VTASNPALPGDAPPGVGIAGAPRVVVEVLLGIEVEVVVELGVVVDGEVVELGIVVGVVEGVVPIVVGGSDTFDDKYLAGDDRPTVLTRPYAMPPASAITTTAIATVRCSRVRNLVRRDSISAGRFCPSASGRRCRNLRPFNIPLKEPIGRYESAIPDLLRGAV